MKKRVFRNKIVYWISIVYLLTILYAIFRYFTHFYSYIEKEHLRFYINVLNFIFAVLILIFLIDKKSKTVLLINLFIGFILILSVFRIVNSFFQLGFFNKGIKGELFLIFLNLVYLFLINYFKIDIEIIKNPEEIDQIGKKNFES